MKALYSPKEVAGLLKINYRKVLDMIALGELTAYRIGGVFRISEEEIQRYLNSVKVQNDFWKNAR